MLFSKDAELRSPRHSGPEQGRDGACQFWKRYRQAFAEVESELHQVTETDNRIVLEWSSEAQLPDGKRIRYDGVSILETADGQVQHFRTNYDLAAFVQHVT